VRNGRTATEPTEGVGGTAAASQARKPALLLDDLLPAYDAREWHATVVHASVERVYAALWSANLASPVVRVLLGLRALPGALLGALSQPRDAWRRLLARVGARLTMRDVIAGGFTVVAEDPPRELVLGVDGAFWRLRGDLRRVDAASFRGPQPRGTARAAWNFHVAQRADGTSALSTETRVRCADPASRWRFRAYWLIVRPGSGLIRRLMLRSIRRDAERRP
jgi:hypothetical protein